MSVFDWLDIDEILKGCKAAGHVSKDKGDLPFNCPITGETIAYILTTGTKEVNKVVEKAHDAFLDWQQVPAPHRGELVRLYADMLRDHKEELAWLVTTESGKIYQEALGEVQEMIDICDYAVGLSRQLSGLTMPSERPEHRLQEQWHPLGVVGVISAFNFPVAVFAWNMALAVVCGNTLVWKPSEKTPLSALLTKKLFDDAVKLFDPDTPELIQIVLGDHKTSEALADNPKVKLVSATGSTAMGKAVAPRVAARLGRCLLELGGNNAMIVTESADMALAMPAAVFSAVGTAGQRCTTLRRLFIQESVYDDFIEPLKSAYEQLPIGNPLDSETLVGPLIDKAAYQAMDSALKKAKKQGAIVTGGGRLDPSKELYDDKVDSNAYYVHPAIVEIDEQTDLVKEETFAPILYVMKYEELADAIKMNNDVAQGLSSSIFTRDMQEAEWFMSTVGSDCGIVNVNVGPSGAEIGGAFGGEKDTGGGRESGSDSWKNYMRRTTNTINYSNELPLAQGIVFELE